MSTARSQEEGLASEGAAKRDEKEMLRGYQLEIESGDPLKVGKLGDMLKYAGLTKQSARVAQVIRLVAGWALSAIIGMLRCCGLAVVGLDIKLTREEVSQMSHFQIRLHDAPLLLFWTGAVVFGCAYTRDMAVIVRGGVWNWPTAHMNLQYFAYGLIAAALCWGLVRSLQRSEVSDDGDADE